MRMPPASWLMRRKKNRRGADSLFHRLCIRRIENHGPIWKTTLRIRFSAYGRTKLAGEQLIQDFRRIASDFSDRLGCMGEKGKNFPAHHFAAGELRKRRLKIVSDQIGAPTSSRDIAPGPRQKCLSRVLPRPEKKRAPPIFPN